MYAHAEYIMEDDVCDHVYAASRFRLLLFLSLLYNKSFSYTFLSSKIYTASLPFKIFSNRVNFFNIMYISLKKRSILFNYL